MKRFAVVIGILALTCASVPAHAQNFGIKGGLSYGTANQNGIDPGATQRNGVAVGVGIISSSVIGLGIEGLYAQRGFTSTTAINSRRLDYIDVPLYLRISIPSPGISPFAYAGPQGSYELKCGTDSGDCPDSGRPRITYAGVIGAGAKLGILGGITVEGRYVYGLSDLKLSTIKASSSYKTRSLLLLAGLGF